MVRAERGIGNGGNAGHSERSGVKVPGVGSRIVPDNERLIPVGFSITGSQEKQVKARTGRFEGYPQRVTVPDGTTWETLDRETYHPADYTADVVKAGPVWADPEDPYDVEGYPNFPSDEGTVQVDEDDRPLNPMGPTGLKGRGVLGKWGANFATDAIVTKITDDGNFQMIEIERSDNVERDDTADKEDTHEWAIPGGMREEGEEISETLSRELEEETGVELDFERAIPVYKGGVDDPRNTDNSWMETTAKHIHLPPGKSNIRPRAGSDARRAQWRTLTEENLDAMYANHTDFVKKAIQQWQDQTGFIIDKNGRVGKPAPAMS